MFYYTSKHTHTHICQNVFIYFLRFSHTCYYNAWICRDPSGLGMELSSVQFSYSVMSDSMWPHALQHARPPCPSPTPGACLNPRPSSRWCHPTISSSVVPFSSHLQSFPASGLFQWVSSLHHVATVLEFQLQHQSFQWKVWSQFIHFFPSFDYTRISFPSILFHFYKQYGSGSPYTSFLLYMVISFSTASSWTEWLGHRVSSTSFALAAHWVSTVFKHS